MKPNVKVFVTANEAKLAFKYAAPIEGCNGFAIFKRLKVGNIIKEPFALNNYLGYPHQMTNHQHISFPSTSSPIQRFIWSDFSADEGDTVSYRIVPMLMTDNGLQQDSDNASDWTDFVMLGFEGKRKAYFNRGIVSSQFLAKQLKEINPNFDRDTLFSQLSDINSPVREFLGGDVAKYLHSLLDEVKSDNQLSIFAVLYELNENELEDKLMSIGDRVNLILCNGQKAKKDDPSTPFDEREPNAKADFRLRNSRVRMLRRKLAAGAAHNKFMVICRNGVPERIWTGSTNWTQGGLYTQVNNAILIEDPLIGNIYLKQWNVIKDVIDSGNGNTSPDSYKEKNKEAHTLNDTTIWFAPSDHIPEDRNKFNDLEDVKNLLEQAKSGVLYLMFSPSMTDKHSLYDAILDIHTRKPNLFIHGVLNSVRTADKDNPEISFMRRNELVPSEKVVTNFPQNIEKDFSNWIKELEGLNVKIHSKIIVIDPFGDSPVLVTGSHNLGVAASSQNDENMVIVKNDAHLAHAYAVNILSIFDHYYWRYVASHDKTNIVNKGLDQSKDWMKNQFSIPARLEEVDFWLNIK